MNWKAFFSLSLVFSSLAQSEAVFAGGPNTVASTAKDKEMVYLKVVQTEPKVEAGTFGAEPKEIWRCGRKYLRLAEAPDYFLHIQQLDVIDEPNLWMCELMSGQGVHAVDSGEPVVHAQVIPGAKKPFSDLEWGEEADFFRQKKIAPVPFVANGLKLQKYEFSANGEKVTLIVDAKSGLPKSITVQNAQGKLVLTYLAYKISALNTILFKEPSGFDYCEAADAQKRHNGAWKKDQELSEKLMGYYKDSGQKDLIPLLVRLEKEGALDDDKEMALFLSFFSALIKEHPQYLPDWIKSVEKEPFRYRNIFWNAIWLAGGKVEMEQLKAIVEQKGGDDKKFIEGMLPRKPLSVLSVPLSPMVLDMLWMSFMSSGNTVYVRRIMDALPGLDGLNEKSGNKDMSKIMTAGAARWSLTSNCVQHAKVLQFCREESTRNPALKKYLDQIIKRADETIKNPRANVG